MNEIMVFPYLLLIKKVKASLINHSFPVVIKNVCLILFNSPLNTLKNITNTNSMVLYITQKSIKKFLILYFLSFENSNVNLQVNQRNKGSDRVKPTVIEDFTLFLKYSALFLIIHIFNYSKTLP